MCRKEWYTREEFLADRTMVMDGYQVNRRRIEAGLPPEGILLFTHKTKRCGTTLGIAASKFRFAEQRMAGTQARNGRECSGRVSPEP
jgi:hypothetical protein